MGSVSPQQLESLLRPRTVLRLGPAGDRMIWTGAGIRDPRRGEQADLALVSGKGKRLAARIQQAGRRAACALLLTGEAVDLTGARSAMLLGPGSGLWTRRLRAGIEGGGYRAGQGEPMLALAQDKLVAQHLHAEAKRRRLPLAAILACSGAGGASWQELVEAAGQLPAPPPLLLALHRGPLTPADLAALRRHPRPVAILLAGEARGELAWQECPLEQPPTAEEVCRALGIARLDCAADLAAAGALLNAGGVPPGPRVLILCRSDGEEALLTHAWEDMAACKACQVRTLRLDHPGSSRPWPRRPELTLAGPDGAPKRLSGRLATVSLGLDGAEDARATLHALAALARAAAGAGGAVRRPRGLNPGEAARLLDGWPHELHELRAGELSACYGLSPPPGELAMSASGASRIAGEVGLPVAVKPVGPSLRGRQAMGAVALDVDTPSAARQAFRDVLLPLSDREPPVLLEGVLVSAMVPLPVALECTVIWPGDGPALLTLALRLASGHHAGRLVLACPVARDLATRAAGRLAADGLWGKGVAAPAADLNRLGQTVRALSWLGPDLAGRMRWLRLDTVSPPSGDRPAMLIDGCGEQIEARRDPRR